MPFDGSGGFSRMMNWVADATADIKIRADRHDTEDDNFAQGLSNTITRDGQSQVTADISLNNHRLTNVAAPVNPQDAANKAYADAVKSFSTSMTLSGNAADGRINFTGTGTVGLGFTAADLAFGVRTGDEIASHHRYVWNGKPDFSGTDGMVLTDEAQLSIGQVPPFAAGAGVYAPLHTTDQSYAMNAYWSNADSKWHFLTAGWASLFAVSKAAKEVAIYRSSVSGAADAVITWSELIKWNASGEALLPTSVYAGTAFLQGNTGNIVGSGWAPWGASDAITAINNRIEARAQAWVEDRAATNARMAGYLGYSGSGGAGAYFETNGYVMTAVQKVSGDSYNMWFRQPQVYIAHLGGWVAFGW